MTRTEKYKEYREEIRRQNLIFKELSHCKKQDIDYLKELFNIASKKHAGKEND